MSTRPRVGSPMAQSLGAYTEHITDPAEVGPAIERVKETSATGKPCVLEMITWGSWYFRSIIGRRTVLTGAQPDRRPTRDML